MKYICETCRQEFSDYAKCRDHEMTHATRLVRLLELTMYPYTGKVMTKVVEMEADAAGALCVPLLQPRTIKPVTGDAMLWCRPEDREKALERLRDYSIAAIDIEIEGLYKARVGAQRAYEHAVQTSKEAQ